MKGLFLGLLGVIVLSNTSCRKPKHKATDLDGTWERIESNDGRYIGMEVLFNEGIGAITKLPASPTGYFELGYVKWKDVTPVINTFYEYEFQELSSDNTYISGSIDIDESLDTIKISSFFNEAPGSEQIWVRR